MSLFCVCFRSLSVDTLLYAQKDSERDNFTTLRCHWVKERLSMLCQLAGLLINAAPTSGDMDEYDMNRLNQLAAVRSQVCLCVCVCVCVRVFLCV